MWDLVIAGHLSMGELDTVSIDDIEMLSEATYACRSAEAKANK